MNRPPALRRLGIGDLALMIAGLAVGFWLFGMLPGGTGGDGGGDQPYAVWIGMLGGLSVIGPPILIMARRRERRRFGPGEIMWFSQGMSAWLLWPPVIYYRVQTPPPGGPIAAVCFAYGTPLMAIYLGSALLFGGWIRKGRKNRRPRSWREKFGLILGVLWACTGGYCLYMIWGSK